MKTRTPEIWLIKSDKAANTYMDEVYKESAFTGCHKGYTMVPQKNPSLLWT
ncbi:hypothetical protein [Paenibacillus chitinolyticus]|uniref:Uncharacterized protein n=1 Tax=Paenibacillus chitinolyticus TaxID=79263 RepID=A0ABT4FEZ2_9BACL|nr:hypothetical protein [Paenibacillus chitinolyticus]MCY9590006.1 hypothetical protein [Paenibacillus chitinolyticus]MCY9597065.1 hypothetical protein [Paenibacillus chitinolyticus]